MVESSGRAEFYCPENECWYKMCNGNPMFYSAIGSDWVPSSFWPLYGKTCCPRPSPAWSGEGLPPVGLRCEAAIPHTSGPDNERSFIWIEGSVIAYYEIKGKTYAWFAEDDGFYPPNVLEFRPVLTPEQVAAEEREAAIDEMFKHFGGVGGLTRKQCAWVIGEGYRKQSDQ